MESRREPRQLWMRALLCALTEECAESGYLLVFDSLRPLLSRVFLNVCVYLLPFIFFLRSSRSVTHLVNSEGIHPSQALGNPTRIFSVYSSRFSPFLPWIHRVQRDKQNLFNVPLLETRELVRYKRSCIYMCVANVTHIYVRLSSRERRKRRNE